MLPDTDKAAYSIRRIRLSAWSSETEVIEPAVCLIGRRARAVANCAPAGVDDSREAVYVQRDAIRGVFQGSSGLSNRGQWEIPSSGEGWAIAMSWPTLPLPHKRSPRIHI